MKYIIGIAALLLLWYFGNGWYAVIAAIIYLLIIGNRWQKEEAIKKVKQDIEKEIDDLERKNEQNETDEHE